MAGSTEARLNAIEQMLALMLVKSWTKENRLVGDSIEHDALDALRARYGDQETFDEMERILKLATSLYQPIANELVAQAANEMREE